ncbi:hypothetical protein [Fusobacterium animalis]
MRSAGARATSLKIISTIIFNFGAGAGQLDERLIQGEILWR